MQEASYLTNTVQDRKGENSLFSFAVLSQTAETHVGMQFLSVLSSDFDFLYCLCVSLNRQGST